MKKMRIILALFLVLMLLPSCSGKKVIVDTTHSQPTSLTGPGSGNAAADLGLEMPQSHVILPVKEGTGLYVYGNGRVKANEKELQVEIETESLNKIAVGYMVKLTNAEKGIVSSGTVTSLPDEKDIAGKVTCSIDILLNDSKDTTEQGTMTSNNEDGSKVSSLSDSLPAVDADVEVTICLPAEEGSISIYNDCISIGSDGNTYVWASEKSQTEATAADFKLTKVVTGDTDGRYTIITAGLKAGGSIMMGF